MWPVNRPDFDTGKTFDQCVSIIRNPQLRTEMNAIREEMLDWSDDYDQRAAVEKLHLIAPHEAGVGGVVGADLNKNYTTRMVRNGVPARPVYDALKILPSNNRCPFCNFGSVETLDHILPKKRFPAFSVKPTNLVGCCDRCNRLKLETAPTNPDDAFLHPYFDGVDHGIWLVAVVVQTTPAVAEFHVGGPAELSDNQLSRIQNQFNELELARLYSDAAADEIVDIAAMLEQLHADGGTHAVSGHLALQSQSRRNANLNSWPAALYDALSHSDWYCDGGFRITP